MKGHATPKRDVQRNERRKQAFLARESDPNIMALYDLFTGKPTAFLRNRAPALGRVRYRG